MNNAVRGKSRKRKLKKKTTSRYTNESGKMHLAEIRSKIESWQHVRRLTIMRKEGGGWLNVEIFTNSRALRLLHYIQTCRKACGEFCYIFNIILTDFHSFCRILYFSFCLIYDKLVKYFNFWWQMAFLYLNLAHYQVSKPSF